MVVTTSTADLELINGSTVLPLMLARPLRQDGSVADGPLTIQEALVASGQGLPLSEWLEPMIIEDWFQGIGLAYDAAPGCDTFSAPGYVLPGGAATDLEVPSTGNSVSHLTAFAEYGDDLFIAQIGDGTANTARVLRLTNMTGALSVSLALGADEYMQDLLVARDASSGISYLWATSHSAVAGGGRLHRWDGIGPSWVSTPLNPDPASFGGNMRTKMVTVFWEGADGVGDWRIVTISSGEGHISYTRPGADPMDPASWVEHVALGTGEAIGQLVAAKRHVWAVSPTNVYDLDELGNSPALTTYTLKHRGNALAVLYRGGYVYRSQSMGLDRVRVDQGPITQDYPGNCSPGFATNAESGYLTGYPHALTEWIGGVLCATWAEPVGRSGVFWGIPREEVGIESPNPLIWHGPFAVTSDPCVVTRMHVSADAESPSHSRLWLATFSTSQLDPPLLSYVTLPPAGGAFGDLLVGGRYRFADGAGTGTWQPFCRLIGLSTTLKDKGSRKDLYQLAVGTRGLPTGTPTGSDPYLTVYNRADASPGSVSWGTGVDVTSGPVQTITPDTTSGYRMETRIDLFSPNGASSPPKPAMLDSVRWDYWRTAPDLDTWTFDVEYGDGVYGLSNSPWGNQGRDAQWYTDALVAMCRAGRLVMRDRQDVRWSVKLKHVLPRDATQHDGMYGKTLRARITVALLGAPA